MDAMNVHAGRDPSTAVDLCAYFAQRSILAQDDIADVDDVAVDYAES